MTVRMAGTIAHLEGDWTLSGVVDNLDSLVLSLDQLEAAGKKSFKINCQYVGETDLSGLQLLNVWLECARLRGINAVVINVTEGMQRAINEFGFEKCFACRSSSGRSAGKKRPA